ncbi:MAG: hypothetical protein HY238_23735 [Acidobacteria bacterium]|nr:hypothetical protein [Acidobacteriota bacterium]
MRLMILGFVAAGVLALAQTEPPKPKPAPKAEPKAAPKAEPSERRQSSYTYDLEGRPVAAPSASEQRRGSTVDRDDVRRDAEGRPVTVGRTEERLLRNQESEQSGERVIQRYDFSGKPVSKQVIKFERRKMPDGSVVLVENQYDQDTNGRMQFVERRTTTEKKTGAGGTMAQVVERPGVNGGLQLAARTDRTETRLSDAVTEVVGSRQFPDANGRLVERDREASVITKSGNATSTETKQWQLGAMGQMEFVGRSVSRLAETPDGSQVEDVEVFATKIGGTTPDLNAPQVPTLEQQVHREKKVRPDGKIVETTSARLRQVADPSRLGGLSVTEKVVTPTRDGQTIETNVSERDYNGRMVKVRREVEEERK